MHTPTLKTISTYRIKRFLESRGYTVSVIKHVKPTNQYREAYSIQFLNGQQVPSTILDRFMDDFTWFSDRNSATRLLLPPEELIWVLPLFPLAAFAYQNEVQIHEKRVAQYTPKEKVVNTKNEHNTKVAFIEKVQTRSLEQIFSDNQRMEKIYQKEGFFRYNLTPEEKKLFEQYIDERYIEQLCSPPNSSIYQHTRFFLPDDVAQQMYDLAYSLGFPKDGKILNPACHVGGLIKPAPHTATIVAFEDSLKAQYITGKLYPHVTLWNNHFEQAFLDSQYYVTPCDSRKVTWVKQYPFDLVIGNPAIGKVYNKYQFSLRINWHPDIERKEWTNELYYLYCGALMLKPGGLLIVATSTKFLREGDDVQYQDCKKHLFDLVDFVKVFRLPRSLFDLAEDDCDILAFRRR